MLQIIGPVKVEANAPSDTIRDVTLDKALSDNEMYLVTKWTNHPELADYVSAFEISIGKKLIDIS